MTDLSSLFADLQITARKQTYTRPCATIPETATWRAPAEFPRLKDASVLAIDCETKDPSLIEKGPGFRRQGEDHAHIVGLAVGTPEGGRWYFPMRHTVSPEQNLPVEHVLNWARDNLCTAGQTKVGANLLYDCDALWSEGVPVTGPWIDVQHAECLLNENRRSYALETLAQEYFGEGKVRGALQGWIEASYGNASAYRADIWRSPPCLVGPYAEGDVDLPLRLWEKQRPNLQSQGLDELFQLETDILPLLLRMRTRGVRVDVEYAHVLDDELTAGMEALDRQLSAVAGRDINVSAALDLAKVFDAAGIEYPRTEKTNQPSFVKGWLESIKHPIADLVVQRRNLEKLRNTFVRGYIFDLQINGRVHALFHSLRGDENGTVSGRFSSSLPNLTNIPARDPVWGPKLRSLFLPEDGEDWGRHDWSQIEYRLLAHYARGPSGNVVRQRYNDDPTIDFHSMTADLIEEVSGIKLGRGQTKNLNFGLTYGMGTAKLAATLGLSPEKTETLFAAYHQGAAFAKATAEAVVQTVNDRGYLTTTLNRRARFDLYEPRYGYQPALPYDQAVIEYGSNVRRAFTHKALNRLLQGSAADLLKYALREFDRAGLDAIIPLLLTCHDELGNTVPRTPAGREAMNEVKRIMENCLKFRVPILAEQSIGVNWGECK